MKKYTVGADVGGSHITCAIFDLEKQELLLDTMKTSPVDCHASADEILTKWATAITEAAETVGIGQVNGAAFAMPGPFDYKTGVALFDNSNKKFENLFEVNVSEELQKRVPIQDAKFRFMNDATAFASGEVWIGAAKGSSNCVAITLGTGFGSAFLLNGIPIEQGDTVPDQGCCYHLAYKDGIADDYFSTRGFVNRWKELTGETIEGAKCIVDKIDTDARAKQVFEDFGAELADLMAPWLKNFSADTIVLGGNISKAFKLFEPALSKQLQANGAEVKVVLSKLGETSAVSGCCRLMDDEYYELFLA
ncbi:MAG: ROK family protein [Mangrovibacterium sp.]